MQTKTATHDTTQLCNITLQFDSMITHSGSAIWCVLWIYQSTIRRWSIARHWMENSISDSEWLPASLRCGGITSETPGTSFHIQHVRMEVDWQTSQPACGESLRRQTPFAAICLKTDEKNHFIGGDSWRDNAPRRTSDTYTYPYCQACAEWREW